MASLIHPRLAILVSLGILDNQMSQIKWKALKYGNSLSWQDRLGGNTCICLQGNFPRFPAACITTYDYIHVHVSNYDCHDIVIQNFDAYKSLVWEHSSLKLRMVVSQKQSWHSCYIYMYLSREVQFDHFAVEVIITRKCKKAPWILSNDNRYLKWIEFDTISLYR